LRSAAGERVLTNAVEVCSLFPTDETEVGRLYTAHLCRAALLQIAGVADATYERVLVLSGHATAFAYHPHSQEALYDTPDPAEVVDARLAGATGFLWEPLDASNGVDSAWEALRSSIDAGRPVHGQWIDHVVFCGYQAPNGRLSRRVWVAGAGGWDPTNWWMWDRFDKWAAEFGIMERVGAPCPRIRPEETIREVVAGMVRCADADPRAARRQQHDATYGLAGLRAFLKDMGDPTKKPDYWHAGWLGGHCVYRQVSGRAAAAQFLAEGSRLFDGPVQGRLQAAARSLTGAAEAWKEWGRWLGTESGVTDAEDLRLLWMQHGNRRRGTELAGQAAKHEAEAARQLKLALAIIGV